MLPIAIANIEDESDRAFITNLYADFYPLIKRKARKYFSDDYLVEDMMQSTAVRLIQNIDHLHGLHKAQLACYVARTVKSVSIDALKKRKRTPEVLWEDEKDDREEGEAQPESYFFTNLTYEAMGQCIKSLSTMDQDLLYYRFYLNYSNKQTAEALGIDEDNIREYVTRARKRALKKLKEAGVEYER